MHGSNRSLKKGAGFLYLFLNLLWVLTATSCTPRLIGEWIDPSSSDAISGTALSVSQVANTELGARSSPMIPTENSRALTSPICPEGATASLYSVSALGAVSTTASLTTPVDLASGSFQFDSLVERGLSEVSQYGINYVVQISGCGLVLERPVTGYSNQNVDPATTLISFVTTSGNTVTNQLYQLNQPNLASLLSALESSNSSEQAAYQALISSPALSLQFQTLFGIPPTMLENAAPLIAPSSLATTANEGDTVPYSVSTYEWYSAYSPAYSWKKDGIVVSTSATYDYTVGANDQGAHTISVYIGSDNGSGVINPSLPFSSQTFTLSVNNTDLATAPALSTVFPASTTTSVRNITVGIGTGAALVNCASFSSLALVESTSNVPPATSSFTITCLTAGIQSASFTLTDTIGSHTVQLWAMDAAGNISALPSTLTYSLTATGPLLSITAPAQNSYINIANAGAVTLSGTCTTTDGNVSISGALSASTPCAAGSWTTTQSFSAVSDGAVSMSVSQTDPEGDTTTDPLALIKDTVAPTVVISAPIAGGYINSTNASAFTVSGTCTENTRVVSITAASGAVTGSPTCSSGTFTASLNFASVADGAITLQASQTDAAGNLGTASVALTKFTTIPTVAINSAGLGATPSNSTASRTVTLSGTGVLFYKAVVASATNCTGANFTSATATAITTNFSFNPTNNSPNTVCAIGEDIAGNWQLIATASTTLVIDTTAPALTLTSPVAGTAGQSSLTLTGACGVSSGDGSIVFSGTGILSNITIPCSSGSYSQLIYFSAGDGIKSLTVSQTDSAGNVTNISRNFVKDSTVPVLTVTQSSPYYTNTNTATFSGTCEATSACSGGTCATASTTINVLLNAVATATTSCTAGGTWSYTTAAEAVDGTYTYSFTQADGAGNVGTISDNWIRLTSAPALAFTSASTFTTSSNSITFQGTCDAGVAITLGGSASGTTSCSGGTWSFTPTQTTDGVYPYTFTQTDQAGNVTTISGSWTRSTSGPVITITQSTPQITTGSTLALSGTCDGGTAGSNGIISITGAITATTTCSSTNNTLGTWSYNASQSVDGNYTYNFSITDNFASPRTSSATLVWERDTTAPVLTAGSFKVNGVSSGTTALSYNPVGFAATDNLTSVTSFCLKTVNSAPSATDSCWYPVNGPLANVAPSNAVTIANYSFNIGIIPQSYSIYLWAMDGAGNISTNTGTAGTDLANITYSPVPPPSVSTVLVANTDTMNGANSERIITGGSNVYIRWTASGSYLGATPVQLFFTTDNVNWTQFATGLPNGNTGCSSVTGTGTASTTSTGCYLWANGSPTTNYTQIRVSVGNTLGATTFADSLPVNANAMQILAGNTETGLNGAAASAVFQAQYNQTTWADAQSLVVNSKGILYFRDIALGLVTVNPANGILTQLIPLGATTSGVGDGGSITNAKLRIPVSLAIDGSDNLYIYDYDRIRKVNFSTSPATINTIIGGGTSTVDTIASGTTMKISGLMSAYVQSQVQQPLLVMPNGNIYFFSDNASIFGAKRMRIYTAATGAISSLYLSGSSSTIGDSTYTVSNFANCGVSAPLIQYSPATSSISALYFGINSAYSINGTVCVPTFTSGNQMDTFMKFNAATGAVDTSQIPPTYFTGGTSSQAAYSVASLDGNSYLVDKNAAKIYQYNSSSNTFITLIGTGTRSSCVDGTAATSCGIDPGGAFVDASSRLYFVDRGRIRTVVNGNVVTLYGQAFNYGDGGLATNARFGLNEAVQEMSNSNIIVHDVLTARMRMITPGGNITTIAGDDTNAASSITNTAATSLSLNSSTSYANFFLDASNNLYYNEGGNTFTRYLPSSYATNSATTWEPLLDSSSHTFFGGSTFTYYASGASGSLAGSLSASSINAFKLAAYNGTSALIFFQQDPSGVLSNQVYSEVNLSTGQYTIDMGPVTGAGSAFCANGTALSACTTNIYNTNIAGSYDSVSSRWLLISNDSKTITSFGSGETGNMLTSTVFANTASSFIFKRFPTYNSDAYFYYCNSSNGQIYLRDASTSTEVALNWPISSVKCTGTEMVYDASADAIIFPFTQNSLSGVAELSNANPAVNGL
jgi:hypothetical protein